MMLPPIEQILTAVGSRTFKSSIDIRQAFFQCALDPKSQPITGFAVNTPGCEQATYCWTVAPFGLKTSGSIFLKALSVILSGLEENAFSYMDDILISNSTFEEHLITLRKVLQRLRDFNMKISGKKCEIARKKLTFLGHELNSDSFSPSLRNIKAMSSFPTPKSIKEVQRFLGLANYYRRFYLNFGQVASPLYKTIKNKVKFEWKEEQQFAFETIKKYLCSSPCLGFPRDDMFFLHVDASTVSCGGALLQRKSKDSKDMIAISYYSKTLSDSMRRWSPTQLELFAIISCLRFNKHIIHGNHCKVYTDHRALSFIMNHNVENDTVNRWAIEMTSYDLSIEYIKGKSNVIADAMSRIENPDNKFQDNTPETQDIVEFPVCLSVMPDYFLAPPPMIATIQGKIKPFDVLQAQLVDKTCKEIMDLITRPNESFETPEMKVIELAEKCIVRKNGCLYRKRLSTEDTRLEAERLFIPDTLKEHIYNSFHNRSDSGGHFNWKKTLSKIMKRYYWPNMHIFIRDKTNSCETCQRKRTNSRNKEILNPVHSRAIFQKVHLDLCGPISRSESNQAYIMAAVCHFSKFVIATAIPDCKATTVARALVNDVILKHGCMTTLVSDNASYLKGELMKEITRLLRIDHHFTSVYRHESNGQIERMFGTFHAMMRSYVAANQMDWDSHLPSCVFAYNTTTHSSTGETPYFLLYGRDVVFNADLVFEEEDRNYFTGIDDVSVYKASLLSSLQSAWAIAYEQTKKASAAFISQGNKTHLKPLEIQAGDIVFLRDLAPKYGISSKLTLPWLGKYRCIKVSHPHITIVSMNAPQSKPKTVHKDLVKLCKTYSGPTVTQTRIAKEEKPSNEIDTDDNSIPGYDHEIDPTTDEEEEITPAEEDPQLIEINDTSEPIIVKKSILKSPESTNPPVYNLRNRKNLRAPRFFLPS